MQAESIDTKEALLRAAGKDPKCAEAEMERLLSALPKQARDAAQAELCRMERSIRNMMEALSAFAERLPKRSSLFEAPDGSRFYKVLAGEVQKLDKILAEAREVRREEIAQAVRDTRQETLKSRCFCEAVLREFPTLSSKARQGIEKTYGWEESLDRLAVRLEAVQVQYAAFLLDRATPFLKQVGRLADVRHRGEEMQSGAVREACESLRGAAEPLLASILKMRAES